METINAIINEMRDEVRTSRENNPDPRTRIFLSSSNMAIEEFADRIEAANKREMKHNGSLLRKAGELCAELMNKMNAQAAAIEKLRKLVEGLLEAATVDCTECLYKCGPNRENCIIHEASKYIDGMEVAK